MARAADQDYVEAIKWFMIAVRNGQLVAMVTFGNVF
jgi:TPR repeat protein